MPIDEKGEPVTQRMHPGIDAIGTILDKDTLCFAVAAFLVLEMTPDDISNQTLTLSMKSGPRQAPLAVLCINDGFSAYLDQPVRLVRLPDDAGDDINFADRMPVLLTTAPSLNALRPASRADRSCRNRNHRTLPARQKKAHCRTVERNSPLNHTRCPRRGLKGIFFGSYARPVAFGAVDVGDKVEVLSTCSFEPGMAAMRLNALRRKL